jgi:hypothetical protein
MYNRRWKIVFKNDVCVLKVVYDVVPSTVFFTSKYEV